MKPQDNTRQTKTITIEQQIAFLKSHSAQEKALKRFQENYLLIGEINMFKQPHPVTGKPMGHKKWSEKLNMEVPVIVPVFRFIGWNRKSKYTGAKLREIRRTQALQVIKDNTEWADGTPIQLDRVIDLQREVA